MLLCLPSLRGASLLPWTNSAPATDYPARGSARRPMSSRPLMELIELWEANSFSNISHSNRGLMSTIWLKLMFTYHNCAVRRAR